VFFSWQRPTSPFDRNPKSSPSRHVDPQLSPSHRRIFLYRELDFPPSHAPFDTHTRSSSTLLLPFSPPLPRLLTLLSLLKLAETCFLSTSLQFFSFPSARSLISLYGILVSLALPFSFASTRAHDLLPLSLFTSPGMYGFDGNITGVINYNNNLPVVGLTFTLSLFSSNLTSSTRRSKLNLLSPLLSHALPPSNLSKR